jgi:hypothetical protein
LLLLSAARGIPRWHIRADLADMPAGPRRAIVPGLKPGHAAEIATAKQQYSALIRRFSLA